MFLAPKLLDERPYPSFKRIDCLAQGKPQNLVQSQELEKKKDQKMTGKEHETEEAKPR